MKIQSVQRGRMVRGKTQYLQLELARLQWIDYYLQEGMEVEARQLGWDGDTKIAPQPAAGATVNHCESSAATQEARQEELEQAEVESDDEWPQSPMVPPWEERPFSTSKLPPARSTLRSGPLPAAVPAVVLVPSPSRSPSRLRPQQPPPPTSPPPARSSKKFQRPPQPPMPPSRDASTEQARPPMRPPPSSCISPRQLNPNVAAALAAATTMSRPPSSSQPVPGTGSASAFAASDPVPTGWPPNLPVDQIARLKSKASALVRGGTAPPRGLPPKLGVMPRKLPSARGASPGEYLRSRPPTPPPTKPSKPPPAGHLPAVNPSAARVYRG